MIHFSERVITQDVSNEIKSLNRPRSITTVTDYMIDKWIEDAGFISPYRSDSLEAASKDEIRKLFQRIYLDGFKAGHNRWPI